MSLVVKPEDEEAIAAEKNALKLAPKYVFANLYLAALYMYTGREDEARAAVAEVHRIDPSYSLEKFAKFWPAKRVREGSPHRRPAQSGLEVRVMELQQSLYPVNCVHFSP